ncbi:hypothetical protein PSYJA_30521 [Pseudomonas syringae pv. japonica str. M301072]|uniref:Uncharacterized protein n=1 Tax=Pseudomonas syringae pv. japonica str. M301072 TaxID=629262 RepID=F3FS64_PSESX|nr:hypothetical protein PSYJA_30521 [Pseudomonas syringae pv. japonica str. M301072]
MNRGFLSSAVNTKAYMDVAADAELTQLPKFR